LGWLWPGDPCASKVLDFGLAASAGWGQLDSRAGGPIAICRRPLKGEQSIGHVFAPGSGGISAPGGLRHGRAQASSNRFARKPFG